MGNQPGHPSMVGHSSSAEDLHSLPNPERASEAMEANISKRRGSLGPGSTLLPLLVAGGKVLDSMPSELAGEGGGGGGEKAGGGRRRRGSTDTENNRSRKDSLGDTSTAAGSGRRESNASEFMKEVLKAGHHAIGSPNLTKHLRRPSIDMNSILPGRRSRRGSSDVTPVTPDGPPVVPLEEVFRPPASMEMSNDRVNQLRSRSTTIGNGQAARLGSSGVAAAAAAARAAAKLRRDAKNAKKLVPTVFRYNGDHISKSIKNHHIWLTGTMTDWKSVQMTRPAGESDFVTIIDAPEGKVFYKFFDDGNWRHDRKQPSVSADGSSEPGSESQRRWNVVEVKRSDVDVFEALACDSFAVKRKDTTARDSSGWTQVKPSASMMESFSKMSRGPPILPPHLLQILLNRDVEKVNDPVLLPEPQSHVSFNHLYAQSIRDEMLVMSTTTRFRKKCITVVLYKPMA